MRHLVWEACPLNGQGRCRQLSYGVVTLDMSVRSPAPSWAATSWATLASTSAAFAKLYNAMHNLKASFG